MRKLTSNQRRGRRHSPEERRRIIESFLIRCNHYNENPHTVLKDLQISESTIGRWQKGEHHNRLIKNNKEQRIMSINTASEILCHATTTNSAILTDAIIRFSIWLRWPSRPYWHEEATVPIKLALIDEKNITYLSDLDHDTQNWISDNIPISRLINLYSLEYQADIYFEYYGLDGGSYMPRECMSDVVWFLLSYKNNTSDRRKQASLNKAFSIIAAGEFSTDHAWSKRSIAKLWSEYATAAPFYYIEQHHSDIDFILDPNDAYIAKKLTHLLDNPDKIERFMAMAEAAIQELTARLDKRARDRIAFPSRACPRGGVKLIHPKLPDCVTEAADAATSI